MAERASCRRSIAFGAEQLMVDFRSRLLRSRCWPRLCSPCWLFWELSE